jgi:hypothetical protein
MPIQDYPDLNANMGKDKKARLATGYLPFIAAASNQ